MVGVELLGASGVLSRVDSLVDNVGTVPSGNQHQ